jgi:hypothetical protein
MRILKLSILLAVLLGAIAPARAQMLLTGAGKPTPAAAASYQGPGDIVSGAQFYGACSRVYNLSGASTVTSLCDLVDSAAPTVVICTLRGTTSGLVDLSAYCAGSVTPSAKCTAATGGTCNVSKVYDQVGGNHWTNATAASQPKLTFSALNGLPGLTGTAASGTFLQAPALAANISNLFTLVSVHKKTGAAASESALGVSGSNALVGSGASANTVGLFGNTGTGFTATATDGVFHSAIGVVNNTSSVLNVDSTETTGTTDNAAIASGNNSRILRGNGCCSMDGTVMEVILYASTMSPANRSALNSNVHGTNGYNF